MTGQTENEKNALDKTSNSNRTKALQPIDQMAYPEQPITLSEPVREIFPVKFDKIASNEDNMYDFRPRQVQAVEVDRPEEASPKGESVAELVNLWTPEMTQETLFEVGP